MVSDLEVFVCKPFGQKEYHKVSSDARYAMFTKATRDENVMPPKQVSLFNKPISRLLSTSIA